MDVKEAIEKIIPDAFETNKVISIQFENVNVKFGTSSLSNRWEFLFWKVAEIYHTIKV